MSRHRLLPRCSLSGSRCTGWAVTRRKRLGAAADCRRDSRAAPLEAAWAPPGCYQCQAGFAFQAEVPLTICERPRQIRISKPTPQHFLGTSAASMAFNTHHQQTCMVPPPRARTAPLPNPDPRQGSAEAAAMVGGLCRDRRDTDLQNTEKSSLSSPKIHLLSRQNNCQTLSFPDTANKARTSSSSDSSPEFLSASVRVE